MSSERYIQDGFFDENISFPKREQEYFYAPTTFEELSQPLKGEVPHDYYILTHSIKLGIYPSQFKYADNNFAIVKMGGELAVLVKDNLHNYYNSLLKNQTHRDKICAVEKVWWYDENMVFNPNNLKDLEVLHGKNLEKATREEIGGKALGEIKLKKYEHFGYEVPEFVVVPTNFYNILQTHGFEGRMEEVMKQYSSASDIAKKDGIDGENLSTYVPRKIEKTFNSLSYYGHIFKPFILPEVTR